jgi:hypothetical protein
MTLSSLPQVGPAIVLQISTTRCPESGPCGVSFSTAIAGESADVNEGMKKTKHGENNE